MTIHLPFGVRRRHFGPVAFEVVQIVKETAQTHSVVERDWQKPPAWGTRPWLKREPFDGARFATEAEADAACERGNAAWSAMQSAVDVASEALREAKAAQVKAATDAVSRVA